MSAFLIDVEGPDHGPVVKGTLAKLEILKSQMKNSQLMVDIAEEEIQDGIRTLRDHLFLSRQSHQADLIWILSELKGVLAHWSDDEIENAATKERVLHLKQSLTSKIEGDS